MNNIIENIRKGEIDINNQDLFFSILTKGLLLNLNNEIKIRDIDVPHFVLHTGDDIMYLENKGYDFSIEPAEVTNESYVYNQIPRCLINPSNVDLLTNQLTNPYSRGIIQYDSGDQLLTLSAEFRRVPLKMNYDLKYYVDSFRDSMELIQQIISKLSFVRTFHITYMGQSILCSYQIPTSFQEEHMMDLDGTTTDNKTKTISLSIEVEASYPVYMNETIISTSNIITKLDYNGNLNNNLSTINKQYKKEEKNIIAISTGDLKLYPKDSLNNNDYTDSAKYNKPHEIS